MARYREPVPVARRDVRHGRPGARTGRSTPPALELQRRIGNRAVAKLMRALWTGPSNEAERSGVTPEFVRTTQLPRGRELFDDRDAKFYFVSTFARSEILVRVRSSVYVYDLDADRVSRYTPGDPVT